MNQYPNAARGLKLMFLSQVISIICAVLAIVPLVNILAIIGLLVAGVISLVGLYKAGSDSEGYKTAFFLTIISLVVRLFNGAEGFFGTLLTLVNAVLGVAVAYYVCTTTAQLLNAVGQTEVAAQSNIWKTYLVCAIVQVVCLLVVWVPVLNVLVLIASMVAAIASIVAYILYMIFLYKSYQALGG